MKSQSGFSILEVLVSLALLGIIGVALLSGLHTVSAVTLTTDERQTGKTLAESQMEAVKAQAYLASYEPVPISGDYTGYNATIATQSLQDSNVQRITVTVSHSNKVVARLEGYKVR
jgi:prepilin-type N-terminal cleavage/methylation domain-containing protein